MAVFSIWYNNVSDHEQETEKKRMQLPEEIPAILSRVIYFLYTGEYVVADVPEHFQTLCSDQDVPELTETTKKADCKAAVPFNAYMEVDQEDEIDGEDENVREDPAVREAYGEFVRKSKVIRGFLRTDTPEAAAIRGEGCLTTLNKAREEAVKVFQTPLGEETVKALKVHALVYKCADMLSIEELKSQACRGFYDGMTKAFMLKGFEAPLEVMYKTIRADDKDLRLAVTKFLVQNYRKLQNRSKTLRIIKEHEGYHTWDLWRRNERVNMTPRCNKSRTR
jgi:hypothetical protein